MNSLPSPASSPSPPAIDASSPPQSRKRQRSQSMHSDESSSSVKRSLSEAPQQDTSGQMSNADQMSSLSLADQNKEIDAYMASQDEQTTPFEQAQDVIKNMESTEKLRLVEERKNQTMEIAQTWFLVSSKWWKRWRKACTGAEDKEGPVSEAELGPVDNTPLLDAQSQLQPGLVEGEDVEFVPEDVWHYFTVWYGQTPHAIPRQVISRGDAKKTTLELYPPRFRVSILTLPRMALGSSTPCEWVTLSAGETITQLSTRLANAVKTFEQEKSHPYRVWKVDDNSDSEKLSFPSERLFAAKGTIMEESSRTLEEEGLESEDSFVVEFKQSGGWIVDSRGSLPHLPTALLPMLNSSEGFFNKMNSVSSPKQGTPDLLAPLKSPVSKSVSLYNNSNSRSTRTLEPGTLGLGNMGNTCFMNSALQCLAHTKELADYFLSGVFEDELNVDNPLGMGGAIAEAFGALLQRIWATTGTSTSYSPREFKQALQRFAPQFSGYQQHDSQELVAFLLDGLHEDLNRILKKPYVEKPDWEGGGDLELFQLAKKSWDGYLMRNDSVVVDLFQGQYQSTLVCPECEKVSITFDPFMYLTLPIPIQKKWTHSIYYIPWDTNLPHCKVPIVVNRDASFKELKVLLGKWTESNPEHLLTLEVFNHRFYKNLDDNVLVGDMSDHDTIVCFQLPCPSQQQRGFKRGPEDPLILPIFLCDSAMETNRWSSSSYSSRISHFGYPAILTIKPEDTQSLDAIYGAVIDRLARFTNHPNHLYDWEGTYSYNAEHGANGNVIPPEENVEEGDIVDEKTMVVDEEGPETDVESGEPKLVGHKKDVFTLRFHTNHKEYGTTTYAASISQKWESWELREQKIEELGGLLCEGDAIYCEFDENMKAYYFGDSNNRYEHARWDQWEESIHPEYEELQKAASEKKDKGITLQDCLDEFTKEEMLGDDDLWYCPRCKKHQQATKRFDLWKAPDILVVHLKRFSNSRSLRDKIDAFIDFPIEDLNLDGMIGERAAARRLQEQEIDIEQLNITSLDEPLLYDLFGVDEHIGGLGGGHYRAYASNHLTGKWYHFDDSYVRPAQASDAVNADAYLLFYRRRTSKPLGGRLQEHIAELKVKSEARRETTPAPSAMDVPIRIDNQLPTPPDDKLSFAPSPQDISDRLSGDTRWSLRSGASVTSLTPSDEHTYDDLPLYTEPMEDNPVDSRFDFSIISNRQSPSSSLGAEGDFDHISGGWNGASYGNISQRLPSPTWGDTSSNLASPSYSDPSSETTNDTGYKTYTTAVEDVGNISETERSP